MIPTERQEFFAQRTGVASFFATSLLILFLNSHRKKDIADGLTAAFFMLGLNDAHLLIKMEGLRPN
jgi:hypothetical protein